MAFSISYAERLLFINSRSAATYTLATLKGYVNHIITYRPRVDSASIIQEHFHFGSMKIFHLAILYVCFNNLMRTVVQL